MQLTMFGGIGCQAQALKNIGAEFEHYRLCEFDKYAVASYNAIHGTSFEKSDIRKWRGYDLGICDTDKFEYIMTYSFPCQDLSIAGKRKGAKKGSGTRSGLLWEVERLLNGCKELPQVLLMENVTQVHSSNNMEDFRMWLEFLESKGYKNYYQDLNATSYGVAQNRNRCFMVSCLGDYYFDFPQGFKLEKRLKDYLEAEVDEKYYLSQKQIENFKTSTYAQEIKDPKCVVVGDLHISGRLESACRVHGVDGVAPTCNTCGGCGLETKILEPNRNRFFEQAFETMKNNKVENGDTINAFNKTVDSSGVCPTLTTRPEGFKTAILIPEIKEPTILQQGHGFAESRELELCPTVTGEAWSYNNFLKDPIAYDEQNKRLRMDGTVGTLTTDGSTPKHNNRVVCSDYRIRKLTPRECWRLMGWQNNQFDKAQAVNSNSQLYKQAGNGIVIQVLEKIFKELL
ncbi:MAG: DNA (cytosine-5-)-methyltransferase [Clostridia bacterium]